MTVRTPCSSPRLIKTRSKDLRRARAGQYFFYGIITRICNINIPRGNTALTADDWRLLAFYSWDTDEQQLLPARDIAATLKRLAMASQIEAPDVSARFALRALAAEATAKETKPTPDSTTIPQLLAMLGNSKLARENFDLIVNYAADIPAYLGPLSQDTQKSLLVAWNASLDQFLADRSLSTADRVFNYLSK